MRAHPEWLRLQAVAVVGLLTSGCGVHLGQPRGNPQNDNIVYCPVETLPPCPTPAKVTWSPSSVSGIKITVDGVDQTSAFTFGNQEANGTLSLGVGPHTVVASCNDQNLPFFTSRDTSTFDLKYPKHGGK
jgi:hypothetical protein